MRNSIARTGYDNNTQVFATSSYAGTGQLGCE